MFNRVLFISFIILISFSIAEALYLFIFKPISLAPTISLIATPTPKVTPTGTPIPRKAIIARINNKEDVPIIFQDVNEYLESKNKPPISPHAYTEVENTKVLEKLKSGDKNLVLIDIREKRERETLIRLENYPNIKYIRFGDLINGDFGNIPKNAEIIVVSFTENREIVSSAYLYSKGFTNVGILKGGLLQWSVSNLPTALNDYKRNGRDYVIHKDISYLLPYIHLQADSSYKVLKFEPLSSQTVPVTLWDSKTLNDYINSLPKDKEYILSCDSIKFCYEATYFWYITKDTIKISGYTGFTGYLRGNPNPR